MELIISFATLLFMLLSVGLAEKMAEKGIRVNCVAPGPVWTPIVVSCAPPERIVQAGSYVSSKETTCEVKDIGNSIGLRVVNSDCKIFQVSLECQTVLILEVVFLFVEKLHPQMV
jgi:hypothetical protein